MPHQLFQWVFSGFETTDADKGWIISLDGLYSVAGQTGSFRHGGGEPGHL